MRERSPGSNTYPTSMHCWAADGFGTRCSNGALGDLTAPLPMKSPPAGGYWVASPEIGVGLTAVQMSGGTLSIAAAHPRWVWLSSGL